MTPLKQLLKENLKGKVSAEVIDEMLALESNIEESEHFPRIVRAIRKNGYLCMLIMQREIDLTVGGEKNILELKQVLTLRKNLARIKY